MSEQNFANHAKTVPAFHFFVLPVLFLNIGWSIYRWKTLFWSIDGGIGVLTSVAILIGFLCARMFALSVQDRVIRLEERLRCERLLPQDLQARIVGVRTWSTYFAEIRRRRGIPGLGAKSARRKNEGS